MIEHLSHHTVLATVRMLRDSYKDTIVLVEGSTDSRFYERFFCPTKCRVLVAHNKSNVLAALEALIRSQEPGVLGIVDRDNDEPPNIDCLLTTDYYDLEVGLMCSGSLDKILVEFGSSPKITKFQRSQGQVLVSLFKAAFPVGVLRQLSKQERLNLKFEDVKFEKFIDKSSLHNNELSMIRTVKNNSQAHGLDEALLHEKLRLVTLDTRKDLRYHCCGHDLTAVLGLGLRTALGSADSKEVEVDRLEKVLRAAFEDGYFVRTSLCRLIVQWEQDHPPYVILSDRIRKTLEAGVA